MHDLPIRQNQAQAVMLTERGPIPPGLGPKPSAKYLDLEKQLMEAMGPEAPQPHMGRSRNDLGATWERLDLGGRARRIAALAEANTATVIPGGIAAYTGLIVGG